MQSDTLIKAFERGKLPTPRQYPERPEIIPVDSSIGKRIKDRGARNRLNQLETEVIISIVNGYRPSIIH
jgi:hypothetical protein